MSKTTNVKPSYLNYDSYSMTKYDRDIVNSIPFHRTLHNLIQTFVKQNGSSHFPYSIIDLGAGTGITSEVVREVLPNATFDIVDFSKQMLTGAKKKLGKHGITYLLKDFADLTFKNKYDFAIAVIGVHHQNNTGKKKLFKNIYRFLKPGGVFIFGDLVTHKNKNTAAYSHAKHYHHLVEKTKDKKTLTEWAYHHMFLNDLAPIEDQIVWLKEAGFKVTQKFLKWNTALLVCEKPKK